MSSLESTLLYNICVLLLSLRYLRRAVDLLPFLLALLGAFFLGQAPVQTQDEQQAEDFELLQRHHEHSLGESKQKTESQSEYHFFPY